MLRPRGLPEAAAAVPAAALVMALGAVTPQQAWEQTRTLLPVVVFLALILVLAFLCAKEGLFEAVAPAVARRCGGSPRRLLTGVFAVACSVTAVLSLDATAVLLTPVVLATAARAGARARPHVYATAHLSNSASLLLPVSNLTNLLAFAASGLTFTRFAALMALPWLAAIAVEYAVTGGAGPGVGGARRGRGARRAGAVPAPCHRAGAGGRRVTAVLSVRAGNNLPAVLALLPLAAPGGPAQVLAVLIGVNLGPNLTYVGSLATLLWRRILHRHGMEVDLGRFTLLGLLTVPTTLAASTVALWGALHLIGA